MIEAVFQWMQQLYEALGTTTQLSPWVYLLVMAGGIASAISPCYVRKSHDVAEDEWERKAKT